jgi:hypothetical protein
MNVRTIPENLTQGKEGPAQAISGRQARFAGIIEVVPLASSCWGIVRNGRDLLWLCGTREKANQRAIEFGADAGAQVRTAAALSVPGERL